MGGREQRRVGRRPVAVLISGWISVNLIHNILSSKIQQTLYHKEMLFLKSS
jgi:hypothetical protein